jgi:hypothetical protein
MRRNVGFLALFACFTLTHCVLDPTRPFNDVMEYVEDCMEPYLEVCEESEGKVPDDLIFRPSKNASIVEIGPTDEDGNSRSALTESEMDALFHLARCIAFVGRISAEIETEEELKQYTNYKQAPDTEADFAKENGFKEFDDPKLSYSNMTEEALDEVWNIPFSRFDYDGPGRKINIHAEERQFGNGVGGNRVVYMHEYLQLILPELYWKLRDIANQALQAGKAAGLFDDEEEHVPISHLGIRVLEYLEYNHKGFGENSQLGWHRDADSIYTMVITLAEPGKDFDGGEFHIKDFDDENVLEFLPSAGCGVFFDSEVNHAVSALLRGRRRSFPIEFWDEGESDSQHWRANADTGTEQMATESCAVEDGIYQRKCWE